IDHLNRDRAIRAALHARRGFAFVESTAAHVAFADDAALPVVDRHLVWAGQRAVAAADALVIQVDDDARHRILLVGVDGAPLQAGRVDAVVAGGSDDLTRLAEHRDRSPRLAVIKAVQAVTGGDACLAARPAVEVEGKGVLLS